MRKKLILIITICLFMLPIKAYAASGSIKASSNSVVKGTSVTITYTVNSSSPIFSIEGTLKCSGAGVSGGIDLNYDDISNQLYTKKYTHKIKPTSAGTVTCSVSGVRVSDYQTGEWSNIGGTSTTIKVSNPYIAPPKEYSSNNYLKSLEVEGYNLEFNKDTLEYSIEVENNVEKVNIKAITEDSKAKVSGTGEIEVTEGSNKIEIKVTAENGNTKVYTVNVTVKELAPIEVAVADKKYNIIRKEGLLEVPENYEKSTINIGEEEVLCYKNLNTGNILIGLKDEEGTAKYYSYNEKNNTYELYNGYKIGGVNLNILSMPKEEIPEGYSKVKFTYNENELEGYQYINKNVTYAADNTVKGSDFYLIYAVNELSGDSGIYVYDKLENTVQRFNESLILTYQSKADNYFLYLLISLLLLAISIITLTLVLIKKKKHKNKFA